MTGATSGTVFLWSEAVLTWMVANYAVRDLMNDPQDKQEKRVWRNNRIWYTVVLLRGLAAAAVISAICHSFPGLVLAVIILLQAIALPLLRRVIDSRFSAELEIAATALFLLLSWRICTWLHLRAAWGLVVTPLTEGRTAAVILVASAAAFVIHGGTYIVRGILDKSGALPQFQPVTNGTSPQPATSLDVTEFNRGRLIGTLERLLLLAMVIAGSYEALAFLMAAKGLIRSKELENRAWAEYFLIGSLASVLVALAAGLCAQHAVRMLWLG